MLGVLTLRDPFSNYVEGIFLCCWRDRNNKILVVSILIVMKEKK